MWSRSFIHSDFKSFKLMDLMGDILPLPDGFEVLQLIKRALLWGMFFFIMKIDY